MSPPAEGDHLPHLNRRRFLVGGLGVAGAAMVPAASVARAQGADQPAPEPVDLGVVPFFGAHQAGIATPAQDRLAFAAFDFRGGGPETLRDLLQRWTEAAIAMSQGQPVPGVIGSSLSPPPDTGEASGLGPSHLTLTIGFGPSLFTEQLGLAGQRPEALVDLPLFPGDRLVASFTGGDLCVQACANDPQVAFHAVRNLARIGRGVAPLRWMQLGFGRTSSTSASQATPRNLMGFKDGTNNLHGEDLATMDEHVWVGPETDQPWMAGGSYLVARRIRMRIESWDRTSLQEQEQIIGRRKTSGSPLTGTREFDTVDLEAMDSDGEPTIPVDSHIRLAAPAENEGIRILRRGYSFTDGIDPLTGELDAGLFFIAFQKDPRAGFIPLQQSLSANDTLNEYIRHVGSAIFACPPGTQSGGFIGESLFV
jgi:deferrochelatase/peroxidase EfeB